MKVSLTDKLVYVIAVLNSILLITLLGVQLRFDSTSYISAWEDSLSLGIIDELRTPVYPLFLGLMKLVAGKSFCFWSIVVQHIVLLVSVFYFKKMADWMIQSPSMARWLTLFYAIIPSTASWANCILTELFAVTGVVFLFYNIFMFYRKPSWFSIVWSTFWLAFLLFLRPAFLYLLPVCFIAWVFYIKRNRSMSISGICGIVLVFLMECCYCIQYDKKFGLFAPSSVSVFNQSYMAFGDGLMKPDYTDNLEYKNFIVDYIESESETVSYSDIQPFGFVTVAKSIQASQKDQPIQWVKKAFGRFYQASQMSFFASLVEYGILYDMVRFKININSVYVFLILFTLLLVYKSISNRTIYIASTLLLISFLGNLITAVAGAQGEWGRLLIPSLPLFFLLIGQLTNYFKIKDNTDDALS